MKRNDDQKEEDAILVGHSQFYAKNTFLLNKKWIDQIFSFDEIERDSFTITYHEQDFSDLIDSIGKTEELFKLYIAGSISKLTEEGKRRGIPDEIASHLMRMSYLRLSDAKDWKDMEECSLWVAKKLHENYQKFCMENFSYLVRQAVEEIHRSKRRKISTKTLAEQLHVNASYLSKIFHEETGKTVSEYILAVKMDQAEILLNSCVYNLTEVAEALGYENYAYFSRQFKKYFGFSPENYIKQKK